MIGTEKAFAPSDVVFFDAHAIRQRHMKLYNNVTLEISNGRVERIISASIRDYERYNGLLGSENMI